MYTVCCDAIMSQIYMYCSPDSARQCALTNHINTSFADLGSGSPGSLSVVHTPIPSPQPSYSSSHKSVRSSRRGSTHKRQRNHSPGHTSSGSEDTIRVCYNNIIFADSFFFFFLWGLYIQLWQK